MKLFKSILLIGSCLCLLAGNAMALPSEWGVIEPLQLQGTPTYVKGSDFGYFIWTDDIERTLWHIRWSGSGAATLFSGSIVLQNNLFSEVAKFSFEANDTLYTFSNPDAASVTAWASTGHDGLDFKIANISMPAFVGFDLFTNGSDANPNNIYIGANKETVFSLGEDQDFAIKAPVPEPATMLLLGLGLVGLAGVARKRMA